MKIVENKNILIVEDYEPLLNQLVEHFSQKNSVKSATNVAKATEVISNSLFDVVLLDLILPDGNGLELISKLPADTPVIILSDLSADQNILQGFDEGAVDYVVKPAPLSILEARMALRLAPHSQSVLTINGLSIDVKKRTTKFFDKSLNLTSNEFNILLFLMQNAGKAFSANQIYENVWKMPHLNSNAVRIHLHNLRKKMLELGEECGNLIIAEYGKGYAFCGE